MFSFQVVPSTSNIESLITFPILLIFPTHGPWNLEKLQVLAVGHGKIPSLPAGGSPILGLGGITIEKT